MVTSTLESQAFKGSSLSFKRLRPMQSGGSLERRVFKEPAMRPNQYAIQIHCDSINVADGYLATRPFGGVRHAGCGF